MIKMRKNREIEKLSKEDTAKRDDCNLCKESSFKVGEKTGYGVVVCKVGNSRNGWFATLSPKTGGNPEFDFTIQLMPISHLTHFSQIGVYPGLERNYGIAFSKICKAMTAILMENEGLQSNSSDKAKSAPIATYGKCTTWKEKKEHLHIKIFPFRGGVGQPYTTDSSFAKKRIFKEKGTAKEFVKMSPVKKVAINPSKFNKLSKDLSKLLK